MTETNTTRDFTYGEKMVGLDFNPANNPLVQTTKEIYAAAIDLIWNEMGTYQDGSEKMRFGKDSITEAVKAQMMTVKALTYKY